MDRREFLKGGVAMMGASALMPLVFRKTAFALQEQKTGGAPTDNGRVLVVVQMAGGNDGLNTIIPIADGRYNDARPGVSIASSSALPLDAQSGLHPSMGKVKDLWDQGLVAAVEGVGYPQPNFSHFVSMDIWQTADRKLTLADGWLGRYFSERNGKLEAPFLGLAIGNTLPDSFRTPDVTVPSVPSLAAYQFQSDAQAQYLGPSRFEVLKEMYAKAASASAYGPQLKGTLAAADISTTTLQASQRGYKAAVAYPTGGIGPALQLVAQAIAANTGVKVCHVSIGGFDTHANESVDQAKQLGAVSDGISAFYNDLRAHNLDAKVLIMTWSEFGRRVKSNASGGTDHGTAGPLFFAGTPVKGGLYGERPDLGNLDNGNLRFTTDFRSVYATAVEGWLGASSKDVLGADYKQLPLLK